MTTEKLKARIRELETLKTYQTKLKSSIEAILSQNHTAVVNFDLRTDGVDHTEILETIRDKNGAILDFSELPTLYQREPFRIYPGAYVEKKLVNPTISFDIQLNAELLLVLFSFLLKKVESRIETVETRLQKQ